MTAELRCEGVRVVCDGTVILDDLDLEVPAGSMTVLVGPSGAGKTTVLRAVAGLAELNAGVVRLGGRDLSGVPVRQRRTALLFQQPRLFPNLDVTENVAFALRVGGAGASARRERAAQLLSEVGLDGAGRRSVRTLSGGEQQRVALARALAASPEVLLLDEPLSAVDPERRDELLVLLRATQRRRGLTVLSVTHDQAEAAELADELAVLLDGRVAQRGPPEQLFTAPRSVPVARFVGIPNLIHAEVRHGQVRLDGASIPVAGPDGPAVFAMRPERVQLVADGPATARVVDASYRGDHHRLRLDLAGVPLEARHLRGTPPAIGAAVHVAIDPDDLWRIPDEDDPA